MNRNSVHQPWSFRKEWGVIALAFFAAMISSSAVADSGWTAGLSLIPAAVFGAFVIGLMIVKSRLPAWLCHLFSLVIGFAWSFRLVATLLPDSFSWPYRWAWLWYRLDQWVIKLLTGGTSADNLVFVFHIALMSWIATYLMLWFIFRTHNVWFGITTSGAFLLANAFYAPNNLNIYVFAYLVAALLLVIRFNLLKQELDWSRNRVHFNAGEIVFDFMKAGILVILFILALAWLTPAATIADKAAVSERVRGPLYDLQSEWNRLFSSLNYERDPSPDFSGRSLGLGGPRQLSDTPVLEIEAPPELRYWRTVSFDTYTGQGWENSDKTMVPFGADHAPLPIVSYQARKPVSHTVTVLVSNTSALAMAGQPNSVSRSARARLSYLTSIKDETSQVEAGALLIDTISFAKSRVPLEPGDRYAVSSSISQASVTELQAAGNEYPAWIIDRYLQLPAVVPTRVRQLAHDIGDAHGTDYDKATAVEQFLRREIIYNEGIPAPPPEREPVDYILFDSREGYCDYYASAMTVMLRSLGIPARVATGYAQGEFDAEKDRYVVRQKHAHSWVEVFFPGYGWIAFEPTAAQLAIVRPTGLESEEGSGRDQAQSPAGEDLERPNQLDRLRDLPLGDSDTQDIFRPSLFSLRGLAPWLAGGLLFGAAILGTVWYVNQRRARSLTEIEDIFLRMLRLAGWAGVPFHDWQTPREQAQAVEEIVADQEACIGRIARLYTQQQYAAQALTERQSEEIKDCWTELRPRLLHAILQQRVINRLPSIPSSGNRHEL